jgi:hypothetical protein
MPRVVTHRALYRWNLFGGVGAILILRRVDILL